MPPKVSLYSSQGTVLSPPYISPIQDDHRLTTLSLFSPPQTDLKATTDAHLSTVLTTAGSPGGGFNAQHMKTDVRLALSSVCVVLAAACFVADRKLPFERAQGLATPAVAVYFALSVAGALWAMFVEAGVLFEGSNARGERVCTV